MQHTRNTWRRIAPILLLFPAIFVFVSVFVAPMTELLLLSFRSPASSEFTYDNYQTVFFGVLGQNVIITSFIHAFWTTIICVIIGTPLAYQASRTTPTMRMIILLLVMFPLLTSSVVRTFGWQVIFYPNGTLVQLLKVVGVSNPPVLIGTNLGVIISMTGVFIPFYVMTLFGVIRNIDYSLEEAAVDLGDRPLAVFFRVVLPLSSKGMAGGALLVFSLSLSVYVIPKLIGQSRILTIATMIYDQALVLSRYELAATFAVALILLVLIIVYLPLRLLRSGTEKA